MEWPERGIQWLLQTFTNPTIIVCGSTGLAVLFTVIVAYVEHKIKNRKDN